MTSGTYPRMTATPMPPATSHTATRSPNIPIVHGLRSVPSECEAFMVDQGAIDLVHELPATGVQSHPATLRKTGTIYHPETPEQAAALRALRSMKLPITEGNVQRELGWSRSKARRYLVLFKAKGAIPCCESGERRSA